jgi:hypothetical protein
MQSSNEAPMTDEAFDVDSYLKDFGRLSYTPLVTPKATLTLEPGLKESGVPAFSETSLRAYPRSIIRNVFPSKIPAGMLPLMVGPSFEWKASVQRSQLAKIILDSDIVYDETGTTEDIKDIGALTWDRLHAAYLLNEIAPDKQVTIITPIRREPENRNGLGPVLEVLSRLDMDNNERRAISAREWLDELMPLARMHFSFFTNMIALGKTLYAGCSKPANAPEFIALLSPTVRRAVSKQVGWARTCIDVYHPNCIDFVGAFAASSDEERRNLFHQFVKARNLYDVHPTLGSRFISGYKSGATGVYREISHPVEYIALLMGRGFIAPDMEKKTFDITPGGWAVIETLRKCPDIVGYHTLVTEISAETRPMTDASDFDPWILEYFEALKLAVQQREDEVQTNEEPN